MTVPIYLGASEVAAAAGLNRYKSPEVLLAKVYRRTRAEVAAATEAAIAEVSAASLAINAAAAVDLTVLQDAVTEEAPAKRRKLIEEAASEAVLKLLNDAKAFAKAAEETKLSTAAFAASEAKRASESEAAAQAATANADDHERAVSLAEELCSKAQAKAAVAAAEQRSQDAAHKAAELLRLTLIGHAGEAAAAEAAQKAHLASTVAARDVADAHLKVCQAAAVVASVNTEADAAKKAVDIAIEKQQRDSVAAEAAVLQKAEAAAAALVAEAAARAAAEAAPGVQGELQSKINILRGIRDEPAAVLATTGSVSVNGPICYRILNVRGQNFRLGAKIDGRTATGAILEVKNRQNRLFHSIPEYELVQVLVYLYVFREKVCMLRQMFQGKVDEKEIIWSETIFRDLVEDGLMLFADNLKQMDDDQLYRRRVLHENPAV